MNKEKLEFIDYIGGISIVLRLYDKAQCSKDIQHRHKETL